MGQEVSTGPIIDLNDRVPSTKGTYKITLNVGGMERIFYLLVPHDNMKPDSPLLINFHGGGGNAIQHMESTTDIAVKRGVYVIYPNGYGR